MPALREALVNAIVHRDYTDGSDIQIKIFDNSITIFSPGSLYGGLTLDDLQSDHYPSRLRNKLIAEAFYLTSNIEKYGSGFIRIRKELNDYPEVQFEMSQSGNGMLLTFRRNEIQPESSLKNRVIALIQGEAIGKRQISQALGQKNVSGQLNHVIRKLLAAELIEMTIPNKPQSSKQRYRLTVKGQSFLQQKS